jgi:hypothetical protein
MLGNRRTRPLHGWLPEWGRQKVEADGARLKDFSL